VVYADIDPVAIVHSQAILAGNQTATVIDADAREPEKLLANGEVRRLSTLASRSGCCGFELMAPGLVRIPLWRPDSPADVPDDPDRFWGLAGVGRKL
jgi:hypothetical protein